MISHPLVMVLQLPDLHSGRTVVTTQSHLPFHSALLLRVSGHLDGVGRDDIGSLSDY